MGCAARVSSPVPLPLDRVECARCGMLISSERGSGEVLLPDGDTRFYDDIACLAADWTVRLRSDQALRRHASRPASAQAFVRLANGKWSDVHDASYAEPADVRTAMGSGLAAFATIAEAQAADREGRALTFDDVVQLAGGSR